MWKNKVPTKEGYYMNEEDSKLKMKVSNVDDDGPEPIKNFTEEGVFKELINIVVDVFSNKSETCLLTFEMPGQSGDMVGWKRRLPRRFCSDEAIDGLHDSGQHWRHSPRKKSVRQKSDRKIPSEQAVIDAEGVLTGREGVLAYKRTHSKPNLWQVGSDFMTGSRRSSLGVNPLFQASSAGSSSLPVEFQDVADALGDLAHIMQDQDFPGSRNSLIYSREISDHFAEIKSRIVSIKSFLHHGSAVDSLWDVSDVDLGRMDVQETSSSRGRKRQRFQLIRVGTGTHRFQGAPSSAAICGRTARGQRNENNQRKKSLEEVLLKYETVKKKETKLVKALLDRITEFKKSSCKHAKSQVEEGMDMTKESSVKLHTKPPKVSKTKRNCRLGGGEPPVRSNKLKFVDIVREKNEDAKHGEKEAFGNIDPSLGSQWLPGSLQTGDASGNNDTNKEHRARKINGFRKKLDEPLENSIRGSPVKRQREPDPQFNASDIPAQRGSPELQESSASISSKDEEVVEKPFKIPARCGKLKKSDSASEKKDRLLEEMKERLRKYQDKRLKNEALRVATCAQEMSSEPDEPSTMVQTLIRDDPAEVQREGSPDFKSLLQRFSQSEQPSKGSKATRVTCPKVSALERNVLGDGIRNKPDQRDYQQVVVTKEVKPNEAPVRGLSSHRIQVLGRDNELVDDGQPAPNGPDATTTNSEVEVEKNVKSKKKSQRNKKCTIC